MFGLHNIESYFIMSYYGISFFPSDVANKSAQIKGASYFIISYYGISFFPSDVANKSAHLVGRVFATLCVAFFCRIALYLCIIWCIGDLFLFDKNRYYKNVWIWFFKSR